MLGETNFNPAYDEVLHSLLEKAQVMLKADGAALEVIKGTELVYRSATGTLEGCVGLRIPLQESFSGRCATLGEILISHDAPNDPYTIKSLMEQLNIFSIIASPVKVHGIVVAVIKLVHHEQRMFTAAHADALEMMTGLIGASYLDSARWTAAQNDT